MPITIGYFILYVIGCENKHFINGKMYVCHNKSPPTNKRKKNLTNKKTPPNSKTAEGHILPHQKTDLKNFLASGILHLIKYLL